MNSVYSVLLKNSALLALMVVSLIFIFTNYIGITEINYIYGILGLVFIFASFYEAHALSKIITNAHHFVYFTDGFFAKRIIKVVAFSTCALFLYNAHTIIKYLAFICIIIVITEIIVTAWRYFKKLSFVVLTNTEIIVATNKQESMAIKDILKIETRHGLTYFVNNELYAITIRSDMMREKDLFNSTLKQWLKQHQLEDKFFEQ